MKTMVSLRSLVPVFLLLAASGAASARSPADTLPSIMPNSNRTAAGRLERGVLRVRLVARTGMWYPEGAAGPGQVVHAFAEEGGPLTNPGPLIRVRAGTELRIGLRNELADTLVVHGLHTRPGPEGDTIRVAPGAVREMRFSTGAQGTYFYWGTTTGAASLPYRYGIDSQLTGAFVVDPSRGPVAADRVFVIGVWVDPDSIVNGLAFGNTRAITVNGRSWPHTDRLEHSAGDTVRWRWINASDRPHPMHLHGFYFRVNSRGTASIDTLYAPSDRQRVVTESVPPGGTFSLTWVPDRAGNWLMHCHTLGHIAPDLRLGGMKAPPHLTTNHALDVMAGLAIGVHVRPRGGMTTSATARERRRLRLLVQSSPARWGDRPGYGFVLQAGEAMPAPDSITIPGPPLVLTRGEPVRITVVNRLSEPTSVHWHGIELESYYDGVSGWSGSGARVAPAIAPGDSFVVEMTPPRAGTFIYHTHFDEAPQLTSGLYGPLIVLEPGERFDAERDRIVLFSTGGPQTRAPPLINGQRDPVLELEAGRSTRLRLININPGGVWNVRLAAGDTPVLWLPLAKDGAPVPAVRRQLVPATLSIGVGETYDFEFTPGLAGELGLDLFNRLFGRAQARVRILPSPAGF